MAAAADVPALRGIRVLRPGYLAALLVLLALALRLYHIGDRSLWLDETYTAHAVRYATLGDVVAWTYTSLDQMPVFNVITWLLRGLGATEWALRLPSALAGALSVLAVYHLGRAVARPRVGLIAALLLAVLPFAVWYGQEARAYAVLMLFSALQMLYAYRAVVRGTVLDWAALALCSILNLYTHYLGLFTAAATVGVVGVILAIRLVAVLTRPHSPRARARLSTRAEGEQRRTLHPPTPALSKGEGGQRRPHPSPAAGSARPLPSPDRGRAGWAVGSAEPTAQAAWAGGEGRQLGLALVAGAVTALAYVPWLPALRAFLHRGDRGFGMFSGGGTAGLADLQSSLATFGFSGFALLLLCVGIVVVVIWIGYGRWREGILLLLWPVIPIAGFWVKLHAATLTVTPRYFSFLAPAAVLLAAVGADGIVAATGWMVRRIGSGRWRQLVASVGVAIVALLLLLETVPALAAQYAMPKTDYRDATARIIATGSPNAVVFAVGTCNYFILGPLDYYLWLHHSSIVVVDGGQLDDRVAARLHQGAGPVWDAIITGSGSSGCAVPVDLAHAPTADLAVTSYDEIALLRVRTRRLGAVAQAKTLLRWGSAYQPQLLSSLDLLNVLSSGARIGPNLLPPPSTTGKGRDRWSVPSDARALPDGSGFELGPRGGSMVNVTLTTRHVTAGTHYLLSFSYRNGGLQGEQKVYVSALAPGGQWLSVFPNGAGYSCSPAADPTRGSFAFTAPAGATSLIIWLRATGSGVAAFQTVRLQPVG